MIHTNRQDKSYTATKLGGTANTLEGKGAIQRDLDWLERWTHRSLMKFNKAMHEVLKLGQGNPKHTDKERTERDPEEKVLEGCSWETKHVLACIGSIRAEQNRHRIVRVGQGGHKDAHRIGTPLLWRKVEWARVVLICRRLWGDFTVAFQYLRGPTKKLGRDSLTESTVTGQRVMAFN